MIQVLEDVRKLAHGTYDDVIVVEHRKQTGASSASESADELQRNGLVAPHVVLEMPERSRVIDTAQQYEIDGVVSNTAPTVGASYRLIVAPSNAQVSVTAATSGSSLRYETMNR